MFDSLFQYAVEIIFTTAISGALGMLVLLFKRLRGLINAVLAINHDQLYRLATFYISSNQITFSELKNLEYIYMGYSSLGGNGTGKELYEKCLDLPIVTTRTKWNPYYTSRMEK